MYIINLNCCVLKLAILLMFLLSILTANNIINNLNCCDLKTSNYSYVFVIDINWNSEGILILTIYENSIRLERHDVIKPGRIRSRIVCPMIESRSCIRIGHGRILVLQYAVRCIYIHYAFEYSLCIWIFIVHLNNYDLFEYSLCIWIFIAYFNIHYFFNIHNAFEYINCVHEYSLCI